MPTTQCTSIKLDTLTQLRLSQLLSPVSPVGSFSYSQGLEWAVNEAWVHDETSFNLWVQEQIDSVLSEQELPLLRKLFFSIQENDVHMTQYWSQFCISVRDTAELRKEERSRAEAVLRVLDAVESIEAHWPRSIFLNSPLVSIAWFGAKHKIELQNLLTAYAYNWLESSLVTGVKIIPLGQSVGQRLLFGLSESLVNAINHSLVINDDCIGVSLPALSMASSNHETQYSRVYRS